MTAALLLAMNLSGNTFVAWSAMPQNGIGTAVKILDPGRPWTELVVSFNAESQYRSTLVVEADLMDGQRPYVLARWRSLRDPERTSVEDQNDERGRVLTDTLRLKQPGGKVRLTFRSEGYGIYNVRFASATFKHDTGMVEAPPNRDAWGKTLKVPYLRQMDYPEGNVICSPTALTMVMNYWADKYFREDLRTDVPAACDGVFDPGWPGYGNWMFNVAFAGSNPGFRAYVARLDTITELEDLIAAGYPVACSIDYTKLQGKEGDASGHLVVLVGFTRDGDPIFNDPGRNAVRLTYKRSDFEAAWRHSDRTVYLVYPFVVSPPEPRFGNWLSDYDPDEDKTGEVN